MCFFCHVEHCQLTTCNVWHEGLPDHFRPYQNTWAPHYAAARDWLKSKGVSALTDRSGVVYRRVCACVGRGRGTLYLTLHCHHQNDFCTKTDSNESHFNVPLTVSGKVTTQYPQLTTFEEKGDRALQARSNQVLLLTGLANTLPLGQSRLKHETVSITPNI